ncbi:DUF2304 domain-containing protein [Chloroflexi bacterium TSY]|nr:DUF2304 domain-containing protein [Chloroflexi bacterium TSY]
MNLFQLITLPLIGFVLLGLVLRLIRTDQPRLVLLFWITLWLGAGIAIYQPDLTIRIAAMVGIGRGADLVLYLVAISFLLTLFIVYNKFRTLESNLTVLVRELAIRDARYRELSKRLEIENPKVSNHPL